MGNKAAGCCTQPQSGVENELKKARKRGKKDKKDNQNILLNQEAQNLEQMQDEQGVNTYTNTSPDKPRLDHNKNEYLETEKAESNSQMAFDKHGDQQEPREKSFTLAERPNTHKTQSPIVVDDMSSSGQGTVMELPSEMGGSSVYNLSDKQGQRQMIDDFGSSQASSMSNLNSNFGYQNKGLPSAYNQSHRGGNVQMVDDFASSQSGYGPIQQSSYGGNRPNKIIDDMSSMRSGLLSTNNGGNQVIDDFNSSNASGYINGQSQRNHVIDDLSSMQSGIQQSSESGTNNNMIIDDDSEYSSSGRENSVTQYPSTAPDIRSSLEEQSPSSLKNKNELLIPTGRKNKNKQMQIAPEMGQIIEDDDDHQH